MKIIQTNGDRAFTDRYCIEPESNRLIFMSVITTREATARLFCSSILLGDLVNVYDTEDVNFSTEDLKGKKRIVIEPERGQQYVAKTERIKSGLKTFYFSMIVHKGLTSKEGSFFSYTDNFENVAYKKMMAKYPFPLLEQWTKKIIQKLGEENLYVDYEPWYDKDVPVNEQWKVGYLRANEDAFKKVLTSLLQNNVIKITDKKQNPLIFDDLDSYLMKYGQSAVSNLRNLIKPLTGFIKKVNILLKRKKPFPLQAALVNAVVARLEKAKYAIINAGMGCGKTFMSILAIEKHAQDMLQKRSNRELSLAEKTELAKYRAVIMAPATLLYKWGREIEEEIPNAKVTILENLEDVFRLIKEAVKHPKPTGKEYYIIGRDFCKLDYQERPAPRKWGRKKVYYVQCNKCGDTSVSVREFEKQGAVCPKCKAEELEKRYAGYSESGWICPECGEILYPCTSELKLDRDIYGPNERTLPLGVFDFDNKKNSNLRCRNCDAALWIPNVLNLSLWGKGQLLNPWTRISIWRNKAKKGRKTVWVHKKFLDAYLIEEGIESDEYYTVKQMKSRRIAPSRVMKTKLPNGFFDYFIADEVHQYKGAGSAQGHTFHTLCKKSKKQIVLTGTILGGVASDMFYLLWRLDPGLMKKKGYTYDGANGVMKFAADYGVIEQVASFGNEDEYNNSSRGKKVSPPQVKPGVSPAFYSEFLFESTVFMDLSDLSSFLPEFNEYIERVDMPDDMAEAYRSASQFFRDVSRKKGGKKLMSTMLQTLLAYPDKPYDVPPIKHPDTGEVWYQLKELPVGNTLLPKEQKVVDLINNEVHNEGRAVWVFTTFTGEDGEKDTLPRLKEVIESNCNLMGRVAILRANTVDSMDREAWIQQQVMSGKKVILSNPKLVEVGFDLLDFPTLIFYQTGYSLFTLWQASRRGYRLNQKQKCKVFYLAYKCTLQDKCLEIMAEKKAATAAIQGKFSSEGLAAMAQGVDPQVVLAEALMNGSVEVDDELLDSSMNIINAMNVSHEMTEEEKEFASSIQTADPVPETPRNEQFSFLSIFANLIPSKSKDSTADTAPVKPEQEERPKVFVIEASKPLKSNKKNSVEGQLTFNI